MLSAGLAANAATGEQKMGYLGRTPFLVLIHLVGEASFLSGKQ